MMVFFYGLKLKILFKNTIIPENLTVFCKLAQAVAESLEGKKRFFLAWAERPKEAPAPAIEKTAF